MNFCYSIIPTRFDDILLVACDKQIAGLYFMNCAHLPAKYTGWERTDRHATLREAAAQLQEYFDGERKVFSLPLRLTGTAFQQRVWREIAAIPFGETVTYSELAERAGAPGAIRAAGTATGRNPIGIVIPCHRVVGKHGALGGYAGGLDRKRRLLELEQAGAAALEARLHE